MGKQVKTRDGWVKNEDLISLTEIGAAPNDAQFIVAAASSGLSGERVATDTASIAWDFSVAGQAKANALLVPVSAGGTGQTTEAEALGEMIQAMSEDSSPDRQLDFASVYDASADTGKKVALYNVAGMAVLASGSASAASALDLALDGYTQFKFFKLLLYDIVAATDGVILWLRFSDDGGVTFEAGAADYAWTYHGSNDSGGAHTDADASDAQIQLSGTRTLGNAANEEANCEITIFNPAGSSTTIVNWHISFITTDGSLLDGVGSGRMLVAGASTDVRILLSSDTVTLGYTLLGII